MSSHHTVLHHEYSLPLKVEGTPTPLWVKIVSAGAGACIAEIFTFPLDTTKVRLQVSWTILYILFCRQPTQFEENVAINLKISFRNK